MQSFNYHFVLSVIRIALNLFVEKVSNKKNVNLLSGYEPTGHELQDILIIYTYDDNAELIIIRQAIYCTTFYS